MTKRIVVIGGGIAGISTAYSCSLIDSTARVVLVEAENQLAYHTTGRSAALLYENYGAASVRGLTRASLDFFHNTPEDLIDAPLLSLRPLIHVGTAKQSELIDELIEEGADGTQPTEEISVKEALELFPALNTSQLERAIVETGTADIDVAALHQAFVRGFRQHGGEITTSTRVDSATKKKSSWKIETTTGELEADVVINAAGAWGDHVAKRAGIEPIGLQPKRRTAFMVNAPASDTSQWAMLDDAAHSWYIKPDGPQLLCSPADETPSEACDAKPLEEDIALAIDRINEATTLNVRSVNSSWAGLRTFTSDRSMVIGPDPEEPSFVWCVGQGGTGIQTSPAAGQLTAELTINGETSESLANLNLDGLLPNRLRRPR